MEKEQLPNEIQISINAAAKELADAYNNMKAAKASMKDLKKEVKEKLENDSNFQELTKREKELKRVMAAMREELQEIKRGKEQIVMELDEQKEIDEFVAAQEEKFGEIKDRVIAQLSRDLADHGMIAEIHYKSGQLILIVARA